MVTFKIKNNGEEDFDFLKKAYVECVNNKIIVDSLYDDIFRPVIKYCDDQKRVKLYQEVWDKIYQTFYV